MKQLIPSVISQATCYFCKIVGKYYLVACANSSQWKSKIGNELLTSATSKFANADFTQDGYQVAQFEIAVVPEPSTYLLMGTGLLGLWVVSARRKRANHA